MRHLGTDFICQLVQVAWPCPGPLLRAARLVSLPSARVFTRYDGQSVIVPVFWVYPGYVRLLRTILAA